MDETYMASELVAKLQEMIAEHGDLPVFADDPDTGWKMEIGLIYKSSDEREKWPKRFEVKTDYYGLPDGNIYEHRGNKKA